MNKPCSNCVKFNSPCSYATQWSPAANKEPATARVAHVPNNNDILPSDTSSHVSASQHLPIGTDAGNEAGNDPSHPLSGAKNPWASNMVQPMVLMTRLAYDELLPLQVHVPSNSTMQATIAPVMLGVTGQMALNSNIGLVKGQLHEPQYPGILPYNVMTSRAVEFEPHIVKLVKNDFIGVNPFQDHDDHITFQAPYVRSSADSATVWDHDGVFTWRNLQKKDVWLSLILKYTSEGSNELNGSSVRSSAFQDVPLPSNNGQKSASASFRRESMPGPDNSATGTNSHNLSAGANTLGLMLYDGNVQFDLKLLEQMKQMLPHKRVIWTLTKRYFQVLYAFCPALDEIDFRTAISKVIGPESYDEVQVGVSVANQTDLINMASLLVVLRFSFVSLFSNRQGFTEMILESDDPTHQELKYLFTHPIDVNAIEICQTCLNQFLFLRKLTVPLFLLAMLLRSYRAYAPEEGDGFDGGKSQMFSSMLVNLGYSLGFNRDPSNFPGQIDARKTNFIRKAWVFLCITDVFHGYRYGNPTSTNLNFFDTKFPSIVDGTENVFDKELDRAVTKIFNLGDVLIDGAMKQIMDVCLNVRAPARLSYVTSLLNMLETCTASVFGSLRDYLRPLETYNAAYTYGKMMKCTILLSMLLFYITMLMHIVGYYRSKGNFALYYYYSKKLSYIVCHEIMAVMPSFVTRLEDLFGDGVSIFMNPLIIDAVYKGNEIIISNILMCNNYLYFRKKSSGHEHKMVTDPDYSTHFLKVTELVALLQRFCKFCVVVESIMSKRYFFAWKAFKSHQTLLLAMSDPRFYEFAHVDPEASPTEGLHNFTSAQLQEVIDIARKGLTFVEKQVTENSDNLSVEEIWGEPLRNDVAGTLYKSRDNIPKPSQQHAPDINAGVGGETSAANPLVMSLDGSPQPAEVGDLYKPLDLQLFAHADSFNNFEVDTLWEQMTSQRLQKHQQMDRAWQGLFDTI